MGFKPNENMAQRLLRRQEAAYSKEQMIEDVFNEEYILVVGSEVIMDRQKEPTGDVNQYILRNVNDILGRNYRDFNELASHSGEGIDVVRNLLNLDEAAYTCDDMSPQLCSLLHTRLFPIVLTTTFDHYLETLMRTVWGDRLRVVNVDDKKSMDNLRNELVECRGRRQYNTPTLLYIFGKAVSDESKKYVRTDDDAIQIIEKWIQLPKEDPILKLIRNKKLLALGCKFSDWYFRFFWYILKREINRLNEGQVAFSLDENSESDQRLLQFLKHSKIYRHSDARTFMDETTQLLTGTDHTGRFQSLVLNGRRRGGIFISYSSSDFTMASQLFFMLRKRGYNVWFDNASLKGGDDYNQEIERAIGETKVFIPLLTPHVAGDLTAGRTDNYYNREWKMAMQLGGKNILPLATNGYDLRAPYHTTMFESLIGGTLSGIDLMTNNGFAKLTEAIDDRLLNPNDSYGR